MTDVDPDAPPHEARPQTAKAVALVLVVVVLAVLVLRHTGSSSAGRAGATGASTTTTTIRKATKPKKATVPLIAAADIKVQVLNGLQSGSLAGNLTTKLKNDGYQTLAAQNTTTVTDSSVIYLARSGYYREARRLEVRLGLKAGEIRIRRTIPSTAPIPAGLAARSDLIVVIGTSLQLVASSP